MSMDMYKEIGSGMPGAVVLLTWMYINRKRMLNNSEYNSDFRHQISVLQIHSRQVEADLSLVSNSKFQYAENQMHQYYIFFFSPFASKCLEYFPSIAKLPAKGYIPP